MKTYVASKNAGKLRELCDLFAGSMLELDAYADYADVEENATSYIGNAMLKARALDRQIRKAGIQAAVLADDSGLEVDALDGRPGIFSARYAGAETSWPQRLGALLDELQAVSEGQRTARFVCVMALILPNGKPHVALGAVEGRITTREIGDGGFGYDPVFYYPPGNCTFAELTAGEKNGVSHRRVAADALLASLAGDG